MIITHENHTDLEVVTMIDPELWDDEKFLAGKIAEHFVAIRKANAK